MLCHIYFITIKNKEKEKRKHRGEKILDRLIYLGWRVHV